MVGDGVGYGGLGDQGGWVRSGHGDDLGIGERGDDVAAGFVLDEDAAADLEVQSFQPYTAGVDHGAINIVACAFYYFRGVAFGRLANWGSWGRLEHGQYQNVVNLFAER